VVLAVVVVGGLCVCVINSPDVGWSSDVDTQHCVWACMASDCWDRSYVTCMAATAAPQTGAEMSHSAQDSSIRLTNIKHKFKTKMINSKKNNLLNTSNSYQNQQVQYRSKLGASIII